MLQKTSYEAFLGINQSDDARNIDPQEVRDALNVTFREGTAKKRAGFAKIHTSRIHKPSWNPYGRYKTEITGGSLYSGSAVQFWPLSAYEDDWADSSNWTLQILVRIGEEGRIQTVLCGRGLASTAWLLLTFTAANVFQVVAREAGGTNRTITGTSTFSVGDVVSIVVRREGDALTMHTFEVDTDTSYQSEGSATFTAAGTDLDYPATGGMIWVGAQPSTYNTFGSSANQARMAIAELRVWSTTEALTDLDDFVDRELPDWGVLGIPDVLYAKLNEGQGNLAADSSSHANEGLIMGGMPEWSAARAITGSYGLVFDGQTSFVQLDPIAEGRDNAVLATHTNDTGGGDFTIAARFHLPNIDVSGVSELNTLLAHRASSAFFAGTTDHYQVRLWIDGDAKVNLSFSERDSGGTNNSTLITATSTASVPLGQDVLIIVTREADSGSSTPRVRIKIDDGTTEDITASMGSGYALVPGTGRPWYIGTNVDSDGTPGGNDTFNGVIDEVAMWFGIGYDPDELQPFLDAAPVGIPFGDVTEIAYNTESVTSAKRKVWEALAFYYTFEEGFGSTIRDKGPNFTSGKGRLLTDTGIGSSATATLSGIWDEPLASSLEAPRIRGVYDFTRCDCTLVEPGQHILAQAQGALFRLQNSAVSFVGAGIREIEGATTLFEAFNQFVVVANPGGEPYEYDGVRFVPLNLEQPEISAATSENISGNFTPGDDYRVRITFINKASGKRSIASERSSVITIGGSDNCLRIVWNKPADDQISHVEIWLTFADQANSAAYFFAREIPVTSGQALVQDPPDRNTVVEQLDLSLRQVPEASSLKAFRGRMWYVSSLDRLQILWSAVDFPELIEGALILNEECTGLEVHRGQLVAYTRRAKLSLVGSDESTFDFVPANPDVGTSSTRTLAKREDVHVYLTQKGWYADTYSQQVYVGERIIQEFEGLQLLSADLFAGAYFDRAHQVIFSCLQGTAATRPNRVYAYNLARGSGESPSWEKHALDFESLAEVRAEDSARNRLYAGWQGFLVDAFTGTNDGASGASDLTGVLTNASAITGAFNSGAAWPTAGDGLAGCVFQNVTQGTSARIWWNTASALIFPVTGGTNSPGDSYRIASIPFELRTRLEDFKTSGFRQYVTEYFLDVAVGSGTLTACAVIDGNTRSGETVTAALALGASVRQVRQPLRRSVKHLELVFSQNAPDVSIELYRYALHHKMQGSAKWTK